MAEDNSNDTDEPIESVRDCQSFKKTGAQIARQYEVVQVLGEGGASVVYRAKHAVLGTECAIKVLLPDRLPDSRVIQRFQLEAKSISRLEHKHIVAVHEFGIDDDHQPYLVMDFVEGKSLAQLTEENSFLLPKRALALFTQIAEALMHAHSRSVIHRDLKPRNVIVERPGQENESARLVDFGIAKITEAENENKSLTQTGEVFGSPLFMSPEQCKGQPLDQRSDIYSFGCLMFEVITGKAAARADSVLETLMLHVNGLNLDFDNTPPAVTLKESAQKNAQNADSEYRCFNGLRRVIETCTATAPEKRYQTGAELLSDLRLIARGHSPAGARSSANESSFKWIGGLKWPAAKTAIAVSIVLGSLGLAAAVFLSNSGERQTRKTEKEKIIDAKFAAIVKDLRSSNTNRRLPVVQAGKRLTSLRFSTALGLKQSRISFVGGTWGGFNSPGVGMHVIGNKIDSAQLAKMEQLGCTEYQATRLKVTDQHLSKFAALKKLAWLDLSNSTGYSKTGLSSFKHSSLKRLFLDDAQLDDRWAHVLASLPLETLALSGNNFTDKGVKTLAQSKTLKFILLENNPISEIPPALNNSHWRLLQQQNGLYKWFCRQ